MLRHYLILKSSGVPLFSFSNGLSDPHYTQNEDIDTSIIEKSTLFSGLMTSIISLGKELGAQLQQIKLNNADLYTYEKNSIIGVSLTDSTEDIEEINEYKSLTRTFTSAFYDKYKAKLVNWDGNTTIFDGFKSEIKSSHDLKEKIDPKSTCKSCIVNCCSILNKST